MDTDYLIIGTGQAGAPLAARLAGAGHKVVIAERADLGGTCVNVGCTPTKTIIASAEAAHQARTAGRLGVQVGSVKVDLNAVVDRKNEVVATWRRGIAEHFSSVKNNLTLVRGHARFIGPREIELGGERYRANKVIINVGARPVVPPIDGLDQVPWLDNAKLLDLRELPEHLLVIGGGYVGCEFGQAFRRFGSEVTMIDPGSGLLSREDHDIVCVLEDEFRKEGMQLVFGERAVAVSSANGKVTVKLASGKELVGSHLLVATGRRPNTDDLGCHEAGITLDARGNVKIDDQFRTSVEGVYAVGDCTGEPQFTHNSWDDHRILFNLLTGASKRGREGRIVPWVVFTNPQVAGVGLNEGEAKKKGVQYEVAKMAFGSIARAHELDLRAGFLKLLYDPKADRILGAQFIGAEVGELLHIFVTLMQADASPRAIVDAQFVHPTFAEGIQSLVMRLERYRLK